MKNKIVLMYVYVTEKKIAPVAPLWSLKEELCDSCMKKLPIIPKSKK